MSQSHVETSSPSLLGRIPQYIQAPETTHELDWADLATLDFSQFDTPGGKEELAKQLHDAIEQIGLSNCHWSEISTKTSQDSSMLLISALVKRRLTVSLPLAKNSSTWIPRRS
jgi:hypothetical protein